MKWLETTTEVLGRLRDKETKLEEGGKHDCDG